MTTSLPVRGQGYRELEKIFPKFTIFGYVDSGFANEPLQQLVLREILITADTATHPVREWVRIMALDKDFRLWNPR